MQVRGYLNTSSRAFTRALDTTPISFPSPITAGEDIILKFQLSQERGGFVELLDLPVISAKARIGTVKTPAEAGTYELEIAYSGDSGTTAAIAWNATAAEIQTILNDTLAADVAALNPCEVVAETGGAYRIKFKDGLAADIEVTDNGLWPLAFVDVEEQAHDDGVTYILSHQQTPVAETTTLGTRAPDLPVVTTKQPGSEEDGTIVNAIQKLVIPPTFAGGTLQLSRGGVKSGLMPLPLSVNAVADAIAITADEGGQYRVSASSNAFFIEFTGTMGGQAQAEFGVIGFDVPGSDYYLKLSTDTAAMAARMRRAGTNGEVALPLHLTVYVENELDEENEDRFDFNIPLVFTNAPGDDAHNASTDLIWDQPPSRLDVLPHSPDAVMVGHRSYRKVIGNGSDTSFSIPHNLGANPQTVTADATTNTFTAVGHNFQNLDPVTFSSTTSVPAPLVAGTTYWVRDRTDDTFAVSLLQGGAAIDLTNTGSGTITARVDDGPSDGYHVTVYERTGDRARIPENAYTVELTSDDALTVSGFASTPTANQYVVHVTKIGRAATYQELELPQARVIDLVDDLDAIRARLAALETLAPAGIPLQRTTTAAIIERRLLPVWAVPRALALPPVPGSLAEWKPFDPAAAVQMRDVRLLPAVHTETVESLPTPLPAAATVYAGRIFQAATARTDVRGGLLAGDYAACDGREWYRVVQEGTETTYYPEVFTLELFRTAINANEFALRSTVQIDFGFETALFAPARQVRARRSAGTWTLLIERGTISRDTTPATTGANLADYFASPVVMLAHTFEVSEMPTAHRFGLTVTRTGAGVISASATIFGREIAVASPPTTATFPVRCRLARPDFENATPDAKGILAVRGLDVGPNGQSDPSLGLLTIG